MSDDTLSLYMIATKHKPATSAGSEPKTELASKLAYLHNVLIPRLVPSCGTPKSIVQYIKVLLYILTMKLSPV